MIFHCFSSGSGSPGEDGLGSPGRDGLGSPGEGDGSGFPGEGGAKGGCFAPLHQGGSKFCIRKLLVI